MSSLHPSLREADTAPTRWWVATVTCLWAVPACVLVAITLIAPFQAAPTSEWPIGWVLGPVWCGAMLALVIGSWWWRDKTTTSGRMVGIAAAMAIDTVLFGSFLVLA